MSQNDRKKPLCYDAHLDAFRVELTQGKEALIDAADVAEVGRFNWCALEIKPGSFYAMRKDGDRAVYLHRVICQPGEGMDVDHANGDTLDCRRSNLRACSRRQNNMNRPGRGASRHKGVDRRGERWRARIDGRSLGVFSTEDEAALAYNRAAVEAHGEFARLNEVQLGYEPDGLRPHSST